MNRRERLMATLRGEAVDRPAVNFYEIGGFVVDSTDADEFNVYNSPDWRLLLKLTEEKTDIIRMCSAVSERSHEQYGDFGKTGTHCRDEFFKVEEYIENTSRYQHTTLTIGKRKNMKIL